MNNKLHTPVGVRDVLADECIVKNEILKRVEKLFHQYGFLNIESPTFEYTEVFSEETGSVDIRQMYKFFDRDGATLALRPDMTPPIARICATAYDKEEAPLRLCYVGNAYRYNENFQGKLREFSQAGVELIGVNSGDCDAELIALAIHSLQITGLSDFRIDIGHVMFFEGVLEEAGFRGDTKKRFMEMVLNRDYIGIEEIVEETTIRKEVKKIILELPKLVGSTEMLDEIGKMIQNEKALAALDKLKNIYEILVCYGVEKFVSFDLGMVHKINYYTGIIFRGYTYGSGFSVVDGGRYDKLLGLFGKSRPATGFTLKINDLMAALERQHIEIETELCDTLLCYTTQGRSTALALGEQLRTQGLYIENSFILDDREKNIQYAESKSLKGLLFFKDESTVEMIDLNKHTNVEVNINELLSNTI